MFRYYPKKATAVQLWAIAIVMMEPFDKRITPFTYLNSQRVVRGDMELENY